MATIKIAPAINALNTTDAPVAKKVKVNAKTSASASAADASVTPGPATKAVTTAKSPRSKSTAAEKAKSPDATDLKINNNDNPENTDTNAELPTPNTSDAATNDEAALSDRMALRISTLVDKIASIESTVITELKDMKAELKNLQKDFVKLQKANAIAATKRNKRKKSTTARVSGFDKPTGISDQLADFLNVSRGSLLSRKEVTKRINQYITDHNLQDPQDRRQLLPNKELHTVLGTTADTKVSYFNYQGFLKGHFIAPPAGATPSA